MAFSSPCLTVLRFCIPTHTNKVVIKECYIPITEKTQNPQGPLKSPVCLPSIFCVPWAGPLLCFCFLSEQAIALLSQTPLLSLVTFCPIIFSNWLINPLMTYSRFLISSPYFLPPLLSDAKTPRFLYFWGFLPVLICQCVCKPYTLK